MAVTIKDTEVAKLKKQRVTLIGGCFDVIHPGHMNFLKKSKKIGGQLVVLLESDENIKKLKGENRPLNNQSARARNLSNIEVVDYIVLLDPPRFPQYYYNLVKLIHPDIIAVTSGDSFLEDKKKQAEMVGAKIIEVMKRDEKFSTSKMLEE